MNIKALVKILGFVLCFEAIFMLPSTAISYVKGQYDFLSFLLIPALMLAIGIPCSLLKVKKAKLYIKDGFTAVAFSWIVLCIAGALPFYISGAIPSFIDSVFETVSGFTTTGASILTDIEALPMGILFWRSMTHWIGGMGVLVLALAVIPLIGGSGINLMKAESPGPSTTKLVPSLRKTAMILYAIYTALTLLEVLCLRIAGMSLYDAFIHAMSTAGTGGFSDKNLSVGYYDSVAIEIIITAFMYLFGLNFTIYFVALTKNILQALKSEELRIYTAIIIISIILISINISHLYNGNILTSVRYASFQTVSIMTTSGFSSTDFNLWPSFSRSMLMLLMVIGSCASSTGGGIKVIRLIILFKSIRIAFKKITHPNIVKTVSIDGHAVDNNTIFNVLLFILLYIVVIIIATLLLSIENFDFTTIFSTVLTMIGNTGPGFEMVGPLSNYSFYSDFSKIIMSLCMLIGRLEILPILFLFIPRKRSSIK
ncbi:MAG: TrkH family potassium uptake protein [Eubacteriaceae bacterium]|nr:TrkH family potassium uptake protein [Eubacteriaceae bacterium]